MQILSTFRKIVVNEIEPIFMRVSEKQTKIGRIDNISCQNTQLQLDRTSIIRERETVYMLVRVNVNVTIVWNLYKTPENIGCHLRSLLLLVRE